MADMKMGRDTHGHEAIYRFCPVCGSPLGRAFVEDRLRQVCRTCSHVIYEDPKVAAATIIEQDGSIVLLRRGIAPSYGKWTFPGGYVNRGEVIEKAAVREAKEEVCLDVETRLLHGVYSYLGISVVLIVFTARVIGGTCAPGAETLEVRWAQPDEIPWDDLAFPSTADALKAWTARGTSPA